MPDGMTDIMVEWLAMKLRETNQVVQPIYAKLERKNLIDFVRPFNQIRITMPILTASGKPVVVGCFYGAWTRDDLDELDKKVKDVWGDDLLAVWIVGRNGRVVCSWLGTLLSPGLYKSHEFLKWLADLKNPELVWEIGKMLDEGKEFWTRIKDEVLRHIRKEKDMLIVDIRATRILKEMALDLYLKEGYR